MKKPAGKIWTEDDLVLAYNYSVCALCWHIVLSTGLGVYLGRTREEASENLNALNAFQRATAGRVRGVVELAITSPACALLENNRSRR